MKLTFRVNGSRTGDAARPVDSIQTVEGAPAALPTRRLGLRVNGSRFATRPAVLTADVLDASLAPAGDRSAS